MDWNARLTACREEYQQVQEHKVSVQTELTQLLQRARELTDEDDARLNVLQGEMNVLSELVPEDDLAETDPSSLFETDDVLNGLEKQEIHA